MGKRHFGHLAGEASTLGGPIAEARPESMNSRAVACELVQQFERHVLANRLAAMGTGEHIIALPYLLHCLQDRERGSGQRHLVFLTALHSGGGTGPRSVIKV